MKKTFKISIAMAALLALTAVVAAASPPVPVAFEVHQGPADPQVRFTAQSRGTALALLDDGGAVLSNVDENGTQHSVRIVLDGARPCPEVEGQGERGAASYYIGNDPAKWRTGIPTWDRVRYTAVWPGIDLVYYAQQKQFEHDFVVAPGADPGAITLRFQGLETKEGEADMTVDAEGDLRLAGGLVLQAPQIYQEIDGTRQPVAGHYAPTGGGRVRIDVEAYDTERPLVIDPVVIFATYLGGNLLDDVQGVAVDSAGNTFFTGYTASSDFPLVNPVVSSEQGSYDFYVAKVSVDGSHLIFSTYLGSSGYDAPTGLAVDAAGNAFVSGLAVGPNYPQLNHVQPGYGGGFVDVVVTKLSPQGNLLYSTYLGGDHDDLPTGSPWGANLAVTPDGKAYVTGNTNSANFPQVHAIQNGLQPGICPVDGYPDWPCADVFLTVIAPAGGQILYSTLWGGTDWDSADAVAVDPSGVAYLLGYTTSPSFPLVNPFQSQLNAGLDLFVMKIRPDGTPPIYATLLAGNGDDDPWNVRADADGNAYVFAHTNSTDLPVKNAIQPTSGGGTNWYIAKINPRGTGIDFATYLGSTGFDILRAGDLDPLGNMALAGYALYAPFPTLRPMSNVVQDDGFAVKIHATGPTLLYSTPLGGFWGAATAVDSRGNVHVGGGAGPGFPGLLNPIQSTYGGGDSDAVVMEILDGFATIATPSRIPAQPGGTVTVPVRFTPGGLDIAFATFSIDYDQTCLTFDPTDANADGIPDAITFTLPAGLSKSVMFNSADTSGEIDISIFDPSPPFTLIPLSEVARITFHVKPTCGTAAVSTLARVGFSSTPAASFGDTGGHSAPGISLDGSVQVWGGLHGDCNGDGAVNAGDLGASVLEMFDGDGSFWLDAPLGSFAGSPAGCDANGDFAIDAGDLSCTILLIFQGQGACGAHPLVALQPPALTIPAHPAVLGGNLLLPIQLNRGTGSINTLAFSLAIPDGLTFDPTDANGDGIPDAVAFRLPAGFAGSVKWTPSNRAGQLAILVMDTTGRGLPLPLSSMLATVTLSVKQGTAASTAVHFGTAPVASFGNVRGTTTPGTTAETGSAK